MKVIKNYYQNTISLLHPERKFVITLICCELLFKASTSFLMLPNSHTLFSVLNLIKASVLTPLLFRFPLWIRFTQSLRQEERLSHPIKKAAGLVLLSMIVQLGLTAFDRLPTSFHSFLGANLNRGLAQKDSPLFLIFNLIYLCSPLLEKGISIAAALISCFLYLSLLFGGCWIVDEGDPVWKVFLKMWQMIARFKLKFITKTQSVLVWVLPMLIVSYLAEKLPDIIRQAASLWTDLSSHVFLFVHRIPMIRDLLNSALSAVLWPLIIVSVVALLTGRKKLTLSEKSK